MRKWCTSEQTAKLLPGQIVYAIGCEGMIKCVVNKPNNPSCTSWKSRYVQVRRMGKTNRGLNYPTMLKWPTEIALDNFTEDPVRPNIFADWLDDHGFPDAAQALREAFPLIPLEE